MPKLVITDLDDTLWQWLTTWYGGYARFLTYLENAHGVPADDSSEAWARFYGDGGGIEFPPTVDYLVKHTSLSTNEAVVAYTDAVHASRVARDAAMTLFPGVSDTLTTLADNGVTVIAHTDSPVTAAVHRLHMAGLDGAVREVYAAPTFDDFGYGLYLLHTADVHVSQWEFKPSTRVLNDIIRHHGGDPSNTFYVGDSLRRDVSMANAAGVTPLWARYGTDYAGRDEALEAVLSVQRYRTFPAEGGLTNISHEEGVVALNSFAEVTDHVLAG